jgi:hypothetical protein
VSAIEQLISDLGEVCAGLPDRRVGQRCDGDHKVAELGLAAVSMFFMGSPSFLAHQRALREGHGRSNCETLFGMSAIPSGAFGGTGPTPASPSAATATTAAPR